jgi:multiple antibiotic resistance protein
MNIYSTALTLIFVMDPLGNIPIFLSVLSHVNPKRRPFIILRECLIAFIILLAFLFFGDDILFGLGISQPSLSIAGGIILFLIALKMIFPPEKQSKVRDNQHIEPLVVPLAIPLVAGPSAIATVMVFATQYEHHITQPFLALLIASTATTIILLIAPQLRRVLGQKGLIAVERLMGMILTTIAVQMFISGLSTYFHGVS